NVYDDYSTGTIYVGYSNPSDPPGTPDKWATVTPVKTSPGANEVLIVAGTNYLVIKRSKFVETAAFSWQQVNFVQVNLFTAGSAVGKTIKIDDVRFVKAD